MPIQQPAVAPQAPVARSAPTATEMYEAARLARRELRSQVDQLEGQRSSLQQELRQAANPTDAKAIEGRLAAVDARLTDVEKQLAAADAQVARSAAVPGVVVEERNSGGDIPPGAQFTIAMGMAMFLLLPLSIALARRTWRRTTLERPALPPDISDRLANMERGIESVAIEVERLGEGQRFVTQLLAESDRRRQQQALPVEPSLSGTARRD